MSVHVELNQPGTTNTTFSLPRLILVEGADDQAVLARLIKHENLAGFSIFNMSGNTAWTTRIQTFQLEPTFDEARLACVRNYFACLGNPKYAQTGSKGYMQAYLAGLPTAPRDLTVAASRRTLDQYLATSAFDELRAFLRALAV
jgi:hypothetical protein